MARREHAVDDPDCGGETNPADVWCLRVEVDITRTLEATSTERSAPILRSCGREDPPLQTLLVAETHSGEVSGFNFFGNEFAHIFQMSGQFVCANAT